MASSEYSPQKRPASTEASAPSIKGYTDDEARDIYARAAQKARLTKNGLVAAGVFAAVSGLTLWSANNSFSARAQAVQSAQSQVENVQQRRHELVPNLISVTKATLKNEQALIEKLNLASRATQTATSPQARVAAETQLGGAVTQTLEKLREGTSSTSEAVRNLTYEIAGTQNRISQEQRKYNQAVEAYNRTASSFPLGFAGRLLGYRPRYDYFQASEAAKVAPKF